jgi:hypothetical protein
MHPTLTPQQVKDRATVLGAISEALLRGARNRKALEAVRRTVRAGAPPTSKQLDLVNDTRERLGMPRVSVPVYDREKKRRMWKHHQQKVNSEHATLVASRPLSPPRLPNPEDMNGAADGFGGSDYYGGGVDFES